MARVDVVVVTYKSGETVRRALLSLADAPGVRVFAVDNASGDGTLDVLRSLPVETIELAENGGFAHGCNVGAAAGEAPFVLFLNPDAHIEPAAVQALADAIESDDGIGAVAPKIVEPDGSLDYSLRRFPRLRSTYAQALFLHRVFPKAAWVDEVNREQSAYDRPGPVEWVSGACVLVRRTVLERLGGLDEGFFHYSEDMDLCARIWKAGYEIRYVPRPSPSTRAAHLHPDTDCSRFLRRAASATRTSTTAGPSHCSAELVSHWGPQRTRSSPRAAGRRVAATYARSASR